MPVITESMNLGDLLKYEAPNLYSRDAITLAAGQNLKLGSVLGQDSTEGKFHAFNPAATDGTENAVGVLANDTDATLIDRDDAILISRHAILARHALLWPEGITPTQKTAATAQLRGLGLVVRTAA
jgi:hypothetical protein